MLSNVGLMFGYFPTTNSGTFNFDVFASVVRTIFRFVHGLGTIRVSIKGVDVMIKRE